MARKPLTVRNAAVLLLLGLIIGYPSWVALEASPWGGVPKLVVLGLFTSALLVLSGVLAFLAVLIRWIWRGYS